LIKSNLGYEVLFKRAGCLKFCQKMDGHHIDVSYQFFVGFDGKMSKVGDLVIPTPEVDIAIATGIPAEGESWFKGNPLVVGECKHLFTKEHQNTKLSVGAPRAYISKEYDELLKVIQRYFTCEGRFNLVYAYHMRLLMHFRDAKALNIPYFLHISLRKMSYKVQKHPRDFSSHLFHCGLIRLLIIKELAKRRKTWGSYLERLGYLPIYPEHVKEKVTVLSRKRNTGCATKRLRGDVERKTPSVAGTPKEIPASSKKVRRLFFTSKKDGLKVCDKVDGRLVEEEIPQEFQEKSTISRKGNSSLSKGAEEQVNPEGNQR